MTDSPLRVAVTGASGYIGARLIRRLQASEDVEFILATDIRPIDDDYSDRVTFVQHDIGDPILDLFAKHRIDSVVHLAYLLNPGRRRKHSRRVNVTGTDNVIEACAASDVRYILYLSSTSVYGAHPDNPDFLTEDHPVRPIPGFLYSEDKLESESRLADFAARNPSVAVTVLRGCPILGPSSNNFISNAFLKPLIPTIAGADPELQFIHEDDLVAVLATCLEQSPTGTYNIAGEGTIKWSEMAARMGSRTVTLPYFAWAGLTSIAWRLRIQSDSRPCGLNFIRHRWTADTRKLSQEIGFHPTYTSTQTWDTFVTAQKTPPLP